MTIRIEALPAQEGDCLWVEWPHAGRTRRMLIDGGRAGRGDTLPEGLAARFRRQPLAERAFDLVICTHLDADHIGGLIPLFRSPPEGFTAHDVWFNGDRQLLDDVLSFDQADSLSKLLRNRSWNRWFQGCAVEVPESGELPRIDLPGLQLTLLSPLKKTLVRLSRDWLRWVEETEQQRLAFDVRTPPDVLRGSYAGVAWGALPTLPYTADPSVRNRSSIAFVAEHQDGSRVLFGADACAEILQDGLRRLDGTPWGRPYQVDLCKVPHHGSSRNLSPQLLARLDCRHWLFSTNGARFGHPDRPTVARIAEHCEQPMLWFNYLSPSTTEYADSQLAAERGFTAVHPPEDRPGADLTVSPGQVSPTSPSPGIPEKAQ
ncbi:ComEC/Rec2 family competence protein [Streptomyces europaeiscabiei]|uniref:ComEC/Rec2 family competence protein n=1 Tax=Streptomyces europaeiscabiei TaxID=146819 RepID=UPI0029B50A26|nr:MBL fold metallo-hydrolase [Streptomyces europaeiscabiei]MDX3586620.1 MBL fold metallo-hydrolase [Streptomyces europaeiscabiei]